MKKKLMALLLSGCMLLGILSGCAVNVANMGTANGEDIDVDKFNYYVQVALSQFQSENTDVVSLEDFEAFEKDGKSARDIVIDKAYDMVAQEALVKKLCEENDVTISEEEFNQLDSQVEQYYSMFGMSLDDMAASAGTTKEVLLEMQHNSLYSQRLQEKICPAEEGAEITEDQIKAKFESDYITAAHILFKTVDDSNNSLSDEEKAKKKQQAEDTLAKIRAGAAFEDFLDLNEDTAMNETGFYSFTKGTMVQEFEDAAFALKDGEVSDIVETTYGYHIIKRYDKNAKPEYYEAAKDEIKTALEEERDTPLQEAAQKKYDELIQSKLSEVTIERNESKLKKIDFKDFLKTQEELDKEAAENSSDDSSQSTEDSSTGESTQEDQSSN